MTWKPFDSLLSRFAPKLRLSANELYFVAPGTPAVAPATRVEVEIDGEKKLFLARAEWQYRNRKDRSIYHVFYCEEKLENAPIWGDTYFVAASNEPSSKYGMLHALDESIKRGHSCRFWRPSQEPQEPFGVRFRSQRCAEVVWRHESQIVESDTFFWVTPRVEREFANWPQREFVAFCEELYADENSQLNFVLRWRELLPEQKDAIAYGCQVGDWKQLRHLFSCVQLLITHHYGPFPLPNHSESFWYFDRPWSPRVVSPEPCLAEMAWATRWRDTICEIMRPSFWDKEILCVSRWRHHEIRSRSQWKIRCGIPTHHELLEAQLELRDFLRAHLTESEIDALMRPD